MFLRHMNRALVGTMLEVAAGRRALEDFRACLDGRPRAQAGRTAPAHGLALASVSYGEEGRAEASRAGNGAITVADRSGPYAGR